MDLKEKLSQELKEAQLKKEELKVSVLRLLFASLGNREIEKRTKLSKTGPMGAGEKLDKLSRLTEEEVLESVNSEAKKRKESILAFEKGHRLDLAGKEKEELAFLNSYLPQQLSETEIRELVKEAVEKTGAKTMQDIGRLMGELTPRTKLRSDGSEVIRIVKEMLGCPV